MRNALSQAKAEDKASPQSCLAKEAALRAERAGLATVPPRMDGSKAPYPRSWKRFQSARPSPSQIEDWYRKGLTGVGLVTGEVSGNLECLDFDDHEGWGRFKVVAEAVGLGALVRRVCEGYAEQSPHGFHLLYRCNEIGGNTKLAQAADKKALIETRGEGGYIITAPSTGMSLAGDYVLKTGGFESIVRITPNERRALHELARSFDEAPKPEHRPQGDAAPGDPRPGDEFNARTTWAEVLESHGWVRLFTRGDTTHWRRPDKSKGESATTNHNGSDLLYVFSTSTPFEAERSYDKFGAYTILNHNGDFKEAAAALKAAALPPERSETDEGPMPLRRELPPSEPFPFDALGSVLGGAARVIRDVVQAPGAICGQSVLAAAALAVQAHGNVELDGRNKPLSLFFCVVGDTGERKSGVDDIALSPHQKHERTLQEKHDIEAAAFAIDYECWEREKANVLKKAQTKADQRLELENLDAEPQPPLTAMFLVSEPTYEGIYKLLANGLPSIGLFSDEGGRFLGGHAMNSNNALKTAAGLSGLWDRGKADRVRGGDGSSTVYGRRLSMHLMIQGILAEGLVEDRLLREQGLLSRVLMAWPETTVGSRPYRAVNPYDTPEIKRYHARMLDILETPYPLAEGKRNELAPRALTLTPNAKALWIQFHDFCDAKAGAGGKLETIRGLANKAAEHALRMAGVLTLVDNMGSGQIDIGYMEAGIHLADFYLTEALRFTEAGACDPDILLAEKVLAWARHKEFVYPAMIYQFGPNGVRTAKDVRRIARILEGHQHWLPVDGGMVLDGRRRRKVWRVVS